MSFKYKYRYKARVTCVNKSVREVSGTAVFTSEEQSLRSNYLLKCQILQDKFKPGEAVGTDNVTLLESTCLGVM